MVKDVCQSNIQCQNGGSCVDGQCVCTPGHTGLNCEESKYWLATCIPILNQNQSPKLMIFILYLLWIYNETISVAANLSKGTVHITYCIHLHPVDKDIHYQSRKTYIHTTYIQPEMRPYDSDSPQYETPLTSDSPLPALQCMHAGSFNPKWFRVSHPCTLMAISCAHRPGLQLHRGPAEFGS